VSAGSVTENAEPLPISLRTSTLPPCASQSSRTRAVVPRTKTLPPAIAVLLEKASTLTPDAAAASPAPLADCA